MSELPVDIVKNIIKFIGYRRISFGLSLQIKRNVSYYQYIAGDPRILSTESIQILRKAQLLIDLVLRPLRETGFTLDIQDIQYPYINVWERDFFQILEILYLEGLCEYTLNRYTYWCDISIGGIKFFLNWRNL